MAAKEIHIHVTIKFTADHFIYKSWSEFYASNNKSRDEEQEMKGGEGEEIVDIE